MATPSRRERGRLKARSDVQLLARLPESEGGHPLLATGTYGSGRTLAWTSDIGPHWLPQTFAQWEGVYTPSSSSFCHRHARANALTSAAVRLRLGRRRDLAPVWRYDALTTSPPLENAWGSVRPACCHPALSLGALPHAAFLSPCCRSSPTRLARPSALIRTRARSPARRPARPGAERFAPARRRTACSRPQRGRRAPTNLRRCLATAGPGECDEFQDLRTAPRPALGSLFRSCARS
jgi:Putative glutamine amidotransferase